APSLHHLDVIPLNPAGFDRAGMILDAGTAMNTTHAGARAFHHAGGATLEAWAGQRHLDIMPIEQRLNLFMSLAREVSEQHSRGTVHAFLQPDNLIVADNEIGRASCRERVWTHW